jgi:hypothetical protein
MRLRDSDAQRVTLCADGFKDTGTLMPGEDSWWST